MIRIDLVGSDAVVARFQRMPQAVRQTLSVVMKRIWLDLQASVVRTKLSGQVLKRRTGVLASSISVGGPQTASEFQETSTEITGIVGTRVHYAAVHEYGGQKDYVIEPSSAKALRFQMGGRTVFAKRVHHKALPERSFLRSTLNDKSSQIKADIEAALLEAMRAS